MLFRNRTEAGRRLASELRAYANRPDAVVLALARGGVPVGFEITESLGLRLDIFLVCKLGLPCQPHLAMGAIASGGVRVLNHSVIRALGIHDDTIDFVAEQEQEELERRERLYRGDRPPADVRGKTVILADDGLAAGSNLQAAVTALRLEHPARLVVAVPIAAASSASGLRGQVDELVCIAEVEPLEGVGLWYDDFTETTDEEVRHLLSRASRREVACDA